MKPFEATLEGIDGTTFHVQDWEPDDEHPKALVALVHGLGEHTGRYAHVGKALTDAGYALAGFDLRGHGKSGGARGYVPSLEVVFQDIRHFFQYLVARYPEIPHFLYGHSLGGLFSLAYALRYGTGLKGVIISAAALRTALHQQKGKMVLVRALGSLAPTLTFPSGLDATVISRDPQVVDAYLHDPLIHDRMSTGLGKAALDAIDYCFEHAADFVPPLLIMHGKADRNTYPTGSEEFASLARRKNGDVTLKLWDGMFHEIHNEPEKEEVLRCVVGWLDAHGK